MTTLLLLQLDFVQQTGGSEMHMWGRILLSKQGRGICISLECIDSYYP